MKQALEIGTVVGGERYIIESVLGVGGFGITYYVRHHELGLHYALKEFFISGKCVRGGDHNTVMLQDIDPSKFAKLKERFIDEARTLAALNHPHVVKVHDFFNENNTSYIVMDYVEGTTLQQIVETKGKMSYDDAVNCMGQLGEAVAYIHSKHVLHRDIKPDNIIVTPDNRIVLIDFGSAREFVHDEVQRHTTILTLGYAPIEQYTATSKKGNYTDIYAMGGVFYFLLTGQRPMDVTTRTMERMPSPHELDPNIPLEVSQTIMKAMEFKPEDRYQSVDAFMADLLGGSNYTSSPQQPQRTVATEPTRVAESSNVIDEGEHKSKAGLIAGIIAGVVALIVILVLVLGRDSGSSNYDRGVAQQYTDYSSQQAQTYQQPATTYEEPATTYNEPAATYEEPATTSSYDEPSQTQFEYLFSSDLSTYELTENDLYLLSAKELTYLRNSVYAKHGREFNSNELTRYFNQFYWYSPNSNFSETWLNSYEKYNVKFIKDFQKNYGKEYKPK